VQKPGNLKKGTQFFQVKEKSKAQIPAVKHRKLEAHKSAESNITYKCETVDFKSTFPETARL